MTTARQLGEMLITGKPMEYRFLGHAEWADCESTFHLLCREYRIKPQVTYYRVSKNIMGGTFVLSQNRPFLMDKLIRSELHIHDFQIEEKS